jgi:hypothetical protein
MPGVHRALQLAGVYTFVSGKRLAKREVHRRNRGSCFSLYAICFSRARRPFMRHIASILIALLIIVITLVAMFTLVRATIVIAQLENPLIRAIAVGAELVLGIVLLLGTVYLATHLAVRIYGAEAAPPRS